MGQGRPNGLFYRFGLLVGHLGKGLLPFQRGDRLLLSGKFLGRP